MQSTKAKAARTEFVVLMFNTKTKERRFGDFFKTRRAAEAFIARNILKYADWKYAVASVRISNT